MHDDKPDQLVDELLEASLKQYRSEEPRLGLEMRILAGIRTRQRAARHRRLVWALALCAGMLAAIVLVLHSAHAPSRKPATSASVPRPTAKPPANSGSADVRFLGPRFVPWPAKKPRTPKPGVRATRPVHPEQFPTPVPVTEQEKLLLAYLGKATEPGLVAGTNQAEEAPPRDLEIPGIKIAGLEIKPLDDSQSGPEK